MQEIKFGFDEDLEKALQKPQDYEFLGATKIKSEILVPSRDWRPYYPVLEVQRNRKGDTYMCVAFANNNIKEMIHKRRYDEDIDYNDTTLGVMSGTVRGRGNSHNNVAETVYKKGVDLEKYNPYTKDMTLDEVYRYPTKGTLIRCLKWTTEYEYGYERVRRENFKEALKESPIQVAVDSRATSKSQFQSYDHSIVLGYIDENDYRHTFESYPDRPTKYDPDYPFSYGMKHWYKKIVKVIVGDYEMKLVRGKYSGDIYFCDSDNILHHVEAPTGFKAYFGQKAWDNKDWINLEPLELDKYEVGLSISMRKRNAFDSLREMFEKYGKKS